MGGGWAGAISVGRLRLGDLGDSQVLQQVGIEGGAEVATAIDVDPHAATGEIVPRCAEEDEVAGHNDEDGAVDGAARIAIVNGGMEWGWQVMGGRTCLA